jgi:uncharacterized SAM-dependent methyltransferase
MNLGHQILAMIFSNLHPRPVAGTKEQLGDAALLVDPKSSEEIALAIKSLYDDPMMRETFIKKGFERASNWTSVFADSILLPPI